MTLSLQVMYQQVCQLLNETSGPMRPQSRERQ